MPIPHPREPFGSSGRERSSTAERSGPDLTPEDLVPHLRGLARDLRERGTGPGTTPREGRV
ncbi:hypothetical protein [Nocardiopsis sp. MG754419]|uniref:hypothetical protein n=1 Tax=Nocardiopsis sp. MG754419 TaxID=2259865 RepID=UPI001BADD916|nr:hypothetical protein [Nocardiopsis sp. MG754419]MBR8742789.1 hypothetical protein [Nocardiopsis sp. MG754419]